MSATRERPGRKTTSHAQVADERVCVSSEQRGAQLNRCNEIMRQGTGGDWKIGENGSIESTHGSDGKRGSKKAYGTSKESMASVMVVDTGTTAWQ